MRDDDDGVQTGGPSFDVPTGRLDGKVSNLRDADALPDVHDGIEALRSKFRANGLDEKDLVLLTGTHACISLSFLARMDDGRAN